jgi:hypothetical protein
VTQPILYIDVSDICEGKLGELEMGMRHLTQFVEANMPRLISYAFFLDQDRTTMTVVAVHPDSASLEFHLDHGNEEFRKFADLVRLSRIEVYGRVGSGSSIACTGRHGCSGKRRLSFMSSMRGSHAERPRYA